MGIQVSEKIMLLNLDSRLRDIWSKVFCNRIFRPADKQAIIESLKVCKKVLDQHGIVFWLEAGTLLGVIREGDIIEDDNDGDISFWLKDGYRISKLKDKFNEYGFYLRDLGSKFELIDNTSMKCLCMFANYRYKGYVVKVKVLCFIQIIFIINDFFKTSFLEKHLWYVISKFDCLYYDNFVRCKEDMIGEFSYINFNDLMYRIPERPQDYLEYKYGDWKTNRVNDKGIKKRLKEVMA